MRRAGLIKVMYTSILTAVALLVYSAIRSLTRESMVEFTSLLSVLAGILVYTFMLERGGRREDH